MFFLYARFLADTTDADRLEPDAGAVDVVGADAINRVPTGRFGELVSRVERVPALRLFVRVAIVLSDSQNKDKHVVALHMIGQQNKSGKMRSKEVRSECLTTP